MSKTSTTTSTSTSIVSQSNGPEGMRACPVKGTDLSVVRGERELLFVPHIEFGKAQDSMACTVIVGPNGAGKSVLIRILCNLLKPDTGQVTWAGLAPDARRRHTVGLLLQKPVLLRRSAMANLVFTLRQTGLDPKKCINRSEQALAKAGLWELREVPANRLSGGEQQRLALTRALLLEPQILFLDEPTASVDPASTLVIEQQLRSACENGLSVVMVSHDQGQVLRLADEIVLMHKGRVVEQNSREGFFNAARSVLARKWIAGELLI